MLTNTQDAMEQEIINRASHDADFRQRLLDNPKAAIAALLNVVLPPGMKITVLEQQPGQHILVLPPLVPTPEALPLDDLELALVGGGRTLRPHTIVVTSGCPNVRPNQTVVKSAC
jgi:hypothetical protein